MYRADDAIHAIDREPWDLVFLDRDLGGISEQDLDGNTGEAVSEWLAAEMIPSRRHVVRRIVIHSLNHERARVMEQALKSAGYRVVVASMWQLKDDPDVLKGIVAEAQAAYESTP